VGDVKFREMIKVVEGEEVFRGLWIGGFFFYLALFLEAMLSPLFFSLVIQVFVLKLFFNFLMLRMTNIFLMI